MGFENIRLVDSSDIAGKGPKHMTRQRLLRTVEFIRKGNSRTKVIEMLRADFGISDVQAKRVYKAAIEYLTPTEEEEKAIRLEVIETLREVISDGIAKGKMDSVVRSLDIINKMYGYYTENIKVSADLNFGFRFGGEEDESEENN